MLFKRKQNREMKRLLLSGAKVYMKWFWSVRHLPGTEKELADVARKALPILGSMGDMAEREGWIEGNYQTDDLESKGAGT